MRLGFSFDHPNPTRATSQTDRRVLGMDRPCLRALSKRRFLRAARRSRTAQFLIEPFGTFCLSFDLRAGIKQNVRDVITVNDQAIPYVCRTISLSSAKQFKLFAVNKRPNARK
jgi:hypothetical protein